VFLFHKADIEVFGRVSTGEVTSHVDVIVTNDACYYIRCRDTFCALSRHKTTRVLHQSEIS